MGTLISQDFKLKNGKRVHGLLTGEFSQESFRFIDGRPTILILSGFGCSHYNGLELEKDLRKDFNVVLLDNRGFGQSEPWEEDYLLVDVALDAIEVMNLIKEKKFHLIGISMGGFLAQWMAVHYGHQLLSLTLFCTTGGGEEFVPMPELTEEGLRTFYALAEPRRTELAVTGTVHPQLLVKNPKRFQEIVTLRRNHPAQIDQVLRQKRAIDDFLKKDLAIEQITTPTLVMSGDTDRFVSPENAKCLHQKIKNSQLEIIPETDHLFFLEKPRLVGQKVLSFLNSPVESVTYQDLGTQL